METSGGEGDERGGRGKVTKEMGRVGTTEGTRKGGREREESRGDLGCRTRDEGGWTSEGVQKETRER